MGDCVRRGKGLKCSPMGKSTGMEVSMNMIRVGRWSVRIFFVLLLACLLALGRGSRAEAVTAGFHVSGRYILDANSVNFIMRGINHPHNWFPEHTSGFQH